MTTQEQVDDRVAIIDLLHKADEGMLYHFGGYPAEIDAQTIPGWVIKASAFENSEPVLEIYRWAFLEAAYAVFQQWKAEGNPDYDFDDSDTGMAWRDAMDSIENP